jgi:hypothetical protein
VEHHGSACEHVRRVGKLADPSRGACWRVEAWKAEISSDLDSEHLICRLGRRVQCHNGAEIAQIHRPVAKTPLLMVLLAERGLGGGAIGQGKGCRRNWRRCRPKLCGHQYIYIYQVHFSLAII